MVTPAFVVLVMASTTKLHTHTCALWHATETPQKSVEGHSTIKLELILFLQQAFTEDVSKMLHGLVVLT
jgi:hypothetical protein